MALLKALLLVCLASLIAGEGGVPIGPPGETNSTTSSTTTTTTPSTTSSTATPTTSSTTSATTSVTTSTAKTTTSSTTTTTTPKTTTSTPTTTSKTTTKTTATPTTTAIPVNPIGTWAVNYTNTNRTCLVLKAQLDIAIYYKDGNSTKNVTVNVPATANATGICNNTTENITLTYGIPNVVNFNFKTNPSKKWYDLESVIVMVNVSIPGQKDSTFVVLTHNKDEFSTPVSNSYKCSKEQSLNLTAVVKNFEGVLRISNFQVQAFRNASSTKFDEALDCATPETPDVVPIAVGCALAALVIIVLIAYLIGRRRSQARGYLSMFAQNKKEEDYIPMKNLSCFN